MTGKHTCDGDFDQYCYTCFMNAVGGNVSQVIHVETKYTEKKILNKKDIRFLFNTNKQGKISEIIVAEFTEEKNPQHLYETYSFDVGNCNRNWDKWSLLPLLINFIYTFGFENEAVKLSLLESLMKIKEFRDECEPYFRDMNLI